MKWLVLMRTGYDAPHAVDVCQYDDDEGVRRLVHALDKHHHITCVTTRE